MVERFYFGRRRFCRRILRKSKFIFGRLPVDGVIEIHARRVAQHYVPIHEEAHLVKLRKRSNYKSQSDGDVAVLFSTEATRTRTAATAPIIMPVMVPELFVIESRESSVEELDDESVVSLALNSAKGKDHQRNSKNKLEARGINLSSSYSLSAKRYDLASEL